MLIEAEINALKTKELENKDMSVNESPYNHLSEKELDVWDNADDCNCDDGDCKSNHKVCSLCGNTVIFNAHESTQPNSKWRWNIDHIIPTSKFFKFADFAVKNGYKDKEDIKNLQIVHVECNERKGDDFDPNFPNGYCEKDW